MDPAISNKIASIAESSDVEDPTTSGAINDLTRDLASGKPANVALKETSIPDSALLVKDAGTTGDETSTDVTTEGGGAKAFGGTEQQSSLSGRPPPATQDPNLFQLSPSTEQKQAEQTTDETTSQGAVTLEGEGVTAGGGVTAFDGGTTTTDTETDDGGVVTALGTGDTDTADADTGDDSDSGDSGDSGDAGDSDDGGDGGDSGGGDGDGGGDSE